jgi:flagellar biosynthesis protein FlhA
MALALVAIVVVMIIPIPTVLAGYRAGLFDSRFAGDFADALYVEEPLKFSVFPGLLLVVTLFRLGAEYVASTRLILGEGNAGSIITAFGNFVVGGQLLRRFGDFHRVGGD